MQMTPCKKPAAFFKKKQTLPQFRWRFFFIQIIFPIRIRQDIFLFWKGKPTDSDSKNSVSGPKVNDYTLPPPLNVPLWNGKPMLYKMAISLPIS